MIWLLIIGIIILGFSVIGMSRIEDKSTSRLAEAGPFITFGMVIGTILIYIWLESGSPKPIDVYRNKTELQITYKVQGLDILQRDTIVVWKQTN